MPGIRHLTNTIVVNKLQADFLLATLTLRFTRGGLALGHAISDGSGAEARL